MAPYASSTPSDTSYWRNYYQLSQVDMPSPFAEYAVNKHLRPNDHLIELGCGNGRDAMLMIRHVARYMGIDLSPTAVEACETNVKRVARHSSRGVATVRCEDFTDLDFNGLELGPQRLVIYSRFSLHSVADSQVDRLFRNLEAIRSVPWVFLLEARTIHDDLYGVGQPAGRHAFRTDHYRRFIDPAVLYQQICDRFKILSFNVATGLAPFGEQDPMVLRAMFSSKSPLSANGEMKGQS